MAISAVLLGTFATGKILEYVIGGCIGNRADHFLCRTSQFLKERVIQTSDAPENHDLQKAVRSSLIDASLILCHDMAKEKYSGLKFLMEEDESQLRDLIKYLKTAHKNLRHGQWISDKESAIHYTTLIEQNKLSEDRLIEIESDLWKGFISEVSDKKMVVSIELEHRVKNGWHHKEKTVRWFELICAFFQEHVKTNHRVSDIIQTKLLVNINEEIEGLQLRKEDFSSQLDAFYSSHKDIVSRLDKIIFKLDEIEASLAILQNQNQDILQEVKTQSLTQEEIIHILNKIYDSQTKSNAQELQQLIKQNKRMIQVMDNIARDAMDNTKSTEPIDRAKLIDAVQNTADDIFTKANNSEADIVKQAKQILSDDDGVDQALALLDPDSIHELYQNASITLEGLIEAVDLRVSLLTPRMALQDIIISYNRLLDVLKDGNASNELLAKYYGLLADVLSDNGQYNNAQEMFYKSLSLFDENNENHQSQLAEIHILLSDAFRLEGNLTEVWPQIEKAEKIINNLKHQDFELSYMLYNAMARYFDVSKKHKQAQFYYQKVLDTIAQSGSNTSSLASVYNNIGLTYYNLDENESATKWFNYSLEQITKDSNAKTIITAIVNSNLGLIKVEQEKYEEAIMAFKTSIDIFEKKVRPNHPNLYAAYRNLAFAHFKLNEIFDAFHYIKRTKDIMDEALSENHPDKKKVLLEYKMIRNSIRIFNFINPIVEKWRYFMRMVRKG